MTQTTDLNHKATNLKHSRIWLLVILLLVVIPAHGIILYYLSSQLALSATVLFGLIAVIVIRHLGLLNRLHDVLRRRRSRP